MLLSLYFAPLCRTREPAGRHPLLNFRKWMPASIGKFESGKVFVRKHSRRQADDIPLDHIQPNPWQTRQGLNEGHVRDLAASILGHKAGRPDTLGLLQVPGGRLVDGDGQPVGAGELG